MGALRRFVDAFNADDVAGMQAACTDATSIVDDFPPHAWNGSRATSRWYGEMASMAGRYGMAAWSVALKEPRQVTVSDRDAYVIVPVDVRWSQDGAPAARTGTMTLALGEGPDGWRISACAWTWD
jgi:ketosteroid isomerase-like protein